MTFMQTLINIVATFGAIFLYMAILIDKDKGKTLPHAFAFAALLAFIVCYNTIM